MMRLKLNKKFWRKSILILLLGVGSLLLFTLLGERNIRNRAVSSEICEAQAMESITFRTDYDQALRDAMSEQKPVMIFFMEADCPFSAKMNANIFSDSSVVDFSRNFVCIQVDMSRPDAESILNDYSVKGSPTVQFLSSRGVPLQQIVKSISPDEFKKQMETVLYSVAWRTSKPILR